jgi:hypothetical protein
MKGSKMNFNISLLVILLIFLFVSCEGEQPLDPDLQNALFPNTKLIEIGIPVFGDTVSNMPAFSWQATGKKFVYLAIFSDRIIIKEDKIVNFEDNVWAWHSGLGTGREGSIYFSDGVDVVGGKLQTGTPSPLISGREYVWAVWAWENDGIKVSESSKEMYFIVE